MKRVSHCVSLGSFIPHALREVSESDGLSIEQRKLHQLISSNSSPPHIPFFFITYKSAQFNPLNLSNLRVAPVLLAPARHRQIQWLSSRSLLLFPSLRSPTPHRKPLPRPRWLPAPAVKGSHMQRVALCFRFVTTSRLICMSITIFYLSLLTIG